METVTKNIMVRFLVERVYSLPKLLCMLAKTFMENISAVNMWIMHSKMKNVGTNVFAFISYAAYIMIFSEDIT